MSRKMSESTLAVLQYFKESRQEHSKGHVLEAFPSYSPKLVDNALRTLLRNGSITREGGVYTYTALLEPPQPAVEAPTSPPTAWMRQGVIRSRARAQERLQSLEDGWSYAGS
jgi:hypothetical protein